MKLRSGLQTEAQLSCAILSGKIFCIYCPKTKKFKVSCKLLLNKKRLVLFTHKKLNFFEQFPQSITVRIKLTKGGEWAWAVAARRTFQSSTAQDGDYIKMTLTEYQSLIRRFKAIKKMILKFEKKFLAWKLD